MKNKYDNIHLIKFNKISNYILYDALNIININLLDKQCILLNSNILYHINILDYYRNSKYNNIIPYIQINNLSSIIELNKNIIISKY